jgi:arsenate reductase-like glutaredoxin family protein
MKRATFYGDLDDPFCGEMVTLLQESGANLEIHNIRKEPLNTRQVSDIVRNHDIESLLNTASEPYKVNRLSDSLPERQQVIRMIAEDNQLFRMPIVVSGNMISVGFNPFQIAGVLQIEPTWFQLGSDEEKVETRTEKKVEKKAKKKTEKKVRNKGKRTSSKRKKSRVRA